MCGIAGIYNSKSGRVICQESLRAMTHALVHRGPDAEGFFLSETAAFGFRRLSIVDLAGGDQPMYNEDRSLVMVCNGEIFNYQELRNELIAKGHIFASQCDVEVIIHLYEEYGTSCIRRLNGQFAFAIFDSRKRQLLLVRDHVGIAPLFYSVCQEEVLFASEIKAILAHPAVRRAVNLTALDQIFTFPGMVSPATMFKDIYSVKPGHFLLVNADGLSAHEYWDIEYPRQEDELTPPEPEGIHRLHELLQQSVNYRLNADVPVGCYVSGGLDSSLIASMIRKQTPGKQFSSFSIAFTDTAIDERYYQKLVTDEIKSTHHEALFNESMIVQRLAMAVQHAEAPLKESYNTCSLALTELVRKNNIKVILSGEGADELFGGYVGYRFDKQERNFDQVSFLERELEGDIRRRIYGDADFIYEKRFIDLEETKLTVYSEGLAEKYHDFKCTKAGIIDTTKLDGRSKRSKRSYLDFKLRISDHLVADHGDRVSYANSVETRYPFLDVNLIDYVKTLSWDVKMKDNNEKYYLKKYASSFLPKQIVDREKFSFVANGSPHLIRQHFHAIGDYLSEDRIRRQGYFNPKTVERLKKIYRDPSFSINQTYEVDLLMIVLTFGIFLEIFSLPNFS